MKLTVNDKEIDGTPKEVIDWMQGNLSKEEQKKVIAELEDENTRNQYISDEEKKEMVKILTDRNISIKDMVEVFRRTRPKDDDYEVGEDGKVDIPINLKEETENKLKFQMKKQNKTHDEIIEKAIDTETKRYDSIDMNEVEGLYELFGIPENDRLKNYQIMKTILNNSYQTCLDDLKTGNEEQKKHAGEEYSTFTHFINPVLKEAKLFELDTEVVPMLTLQDFDEQKSPFPAIAIDCKVWLERNGIKKLYLGFLIGSYYTEDNVHYRAVTTVYADKKSDGTYGLNKDLFILGKKYCKQLTGITGEKEYGKLRKFIYSFLNYINSPEIIIKDLPHNPKNNERRKKKNKVELPPSSKIHIHGVQLRKYVNDINEGVRSFGYSHKFWVRGHYEHFWNKKRYNQIYKLDKEGLKKKGYDIRDDGTVRKWKKAYIKGQGLLIEKEYQVSK